MTSLFVLLDPAAHTFQPVMSAVLAVPSFTTFADGTGAPMLTVPLLQWCAQVGPPIVSAAHCDGPDEMASVLCWLLVGLRVHSTTYLMENLHAVLVQAFLWLVLSFSMLPGSYSVDEERASACMVSGISSRRRSGRSSSCRRARKCARRRCGCSLRLCMQSSSLCLGIGSAGRCPRVAG